MGIPARIRTRAAIAVVATALLAVACGEPPPPPEPPTPPFGLQGDRFYNEAGGYSVALPAGWVPAPVSSPELVLIERDGLAATFSVVAVAPGEDAAARVETTRERFLAAGDGFTVEPLEEPVGPGGRVGRGFLGRGVSGEGRLVLRMLGLSEPGGGGFVLVFESTPAGDAATASDRAAILAGFRPAARPESR